MALPTKSKVSIGACEGEAAIPIVVGREGAERPLEGLVGRSVAVRSAAAVGVVLLLELKLGHFVGAHHDNR